MGWIEAFVPGQYGPEDASVLVGNRDQRLIVANTRMQLDDPAREPVIASVRCENGRSSALEQERAQIVAALFGDPAEPLFAAAAVLFGNYKELPFLASWV
ncbi:hypothetical protein SAMN02787142_7845 [Burkholderia sp. WP9]|nr:hypothetical protein SAMN02787142_7845 [Burkholderia sp. WP9]